MRGLLFLKPKVLRAAFRVFYKQRTQTFIGNGDGISLCYKAVSFEEGSVFTERMTGYNGKGIVGRRKDTKRKGTGKSGV